MCHIMLHKLEDPVLVSNFMLTNRMTWNALLVLSLFSQEEVELELILSLPLSYFSSLNRLL